MNEEVQVTKKEWVMPEIVDLDVDNTTSGDIHPVEITTAAGPS